MHVHNDTQTVINTLALYGVRKRSRAYIVTRGLIRFLVLVAIALVVMVGPHVIVSAMVPHVTPCATEDSTNCYWDADAQGNGQGNSFTDINGTAYAW